MMNKILIKIHQLGQIGKKRMSCTQYHYDIIFGTFFAWKRI